jgi:hypothetical protein
MQTLEMFLADSRVGMRCQQVEPNGDHRLLITERWATSQYRCELHGTNGDRPVTAIVGSDNGPPPITEVVDAIAAEAAVVESAGCFDAWARAMGFDPDDRYGKRVYRAWRQNPGSLRKILGEERYKLLLWETERL